MFPSRNIRVLRDGTFMYTGAAAHDEDFGLFQVAKPVKYFEIHLLEGQDGIDIGFASRSNIQSNIALDRQQGVCTWRGQPRDTLTLEVGDVIGAGINQINCSCFFTHNAELLGTASLHKPLLMRDLRATVAMHSPGAIVRLVISYDTFRFDFKNYLRVQRRKEKANQGRSLMPNISDRAMHQIVKEFMLCRGYTGTLEAFHQRLEKMQNSNGKKINNSTFQESDDSLLDSDHDVTRCKRKVHTRTPQVIRKDMSHVKITAEERAYLHSLITSRQTSKASLHLEAHRPNLCEMNPVIELALISQTFIDYLLEGKILEALSFARERFPRFLPKFKSMPQGVSVEQEGNLSHCKRQRCHESRDSNVFVSHLGERESGSRDRDIATNVIRLPWLVSSAAATAHMEDLSHVAQHIVGLLAYRDITKGPLSYLSTIDHAHAVSRFINDAIISDGEHGPKSTLEMLVWHKLALKTFGKQCKGKR